VSRGAEILRSALGCGRRLGHADRQIDAVHASAARGRAKSYRLHPLGLLLRGHVTYLAATTGGDGSPLLFAVHRLKRVEMRLEPVSLPPGLDLKAALAAGRDQFRSHRQGAEESVLELSCEPGMATLLEEAPRGVDQVLDPWPMGHAGWA
jgi:predicted DNA-binding transcriptional regulator YafY